MSGSQFYEWLFGPEKSSGLSRNWPRSAKSLRKRLPRHLLQPLVVYKWVSEWVTFFLFFIYCCCLHSLRISDVHTAVGNLYSTLSIWGGGGRAGCTNHLNARLDSLTDAVTKCNLSPSLSSTKREQQTLSLQLFSLQ